MDLQQPILDGMTLVYMHVKVERLTDITIKYLWKELGYLERRIFARGKDYLEALEGKFIEKFRFSANAAGLMKVAGMAVR